MNIPAEHHAGLLRISSQKIQYPIPDMRARICFRLDGFPEQVIPLHRRRAYIFGVLAATRSLARRLTTGLFLRLARGFYIPNPIWKLRPRGPVGKCLRLDPHAALEQESDNRAAGAHSHVRLIQRDPTGGRAVPNPI
jgi:hypothetical protein